MVGPSRWSDSCDRWSLTAMSAPLQPFHHGHRAVELGGEALRIVPGEAADPDHGTPLLRRAVEGGEPDPDPAAATGQRGDQAEHDEYRRQQHVLLRRVVADLEVRPLLVPVEADRRTVRQGQVLADPEELALHHLQLAAVDEALVDREDRLGDA